jgi:ligand-binding SRPBCC domain-containing protein
VSYRLERSLFIPKPRREVFAFFADAFNLDRITPTSLRFHTVTPAPIEMRPGTLIDYEMHLYGVKLRWKARIAAFEAPFFFEDEQVKGPYRRWHHRHEFEEVPGGTLMWDRVDYEVGFGPLGALARRLFVGRSVEKIFDYRNEALGKIFGS